MKLKLNENGNILEGQLCHCNRPVSMETTHPETGVIGVGSACLHCGKIVMGAIGEDDEILEWREA